MIGSDRIEMRSKSVGLGTGFGEKLVFVEYRSEVVTSDGNSSTQVDPKEALAQRSLRINVDEQDA